MSMNFNLDIRYRCNGNDSFGAWFRIWGTTGRISISGTSHRGIHTPAPLAHTRIRPGTGNVRHARTAYGVCTRLFYVCIGRRTTLLDRYTGTWILRLHRYLRYGKHLD